MLFDFMQTAQQLEIFVLFTGEAPVLHVGEQSFPQSVAGALLLSGIRACLACARGGLTVDCTLQACLVRIAFFLLTGQQRFWSFAANPQRRGSRSVHRCQPGNVGVSRKHLMGASIHRCQPGNVEVARSILCGQHPSLPTSNIAVPRSLRWERASIAANLVTVEDHVNPQEAFTNLWWMVPGGEGRSASQNDECFATTGACPRTDQGRNGSRSRLSGLNNAVW